MVARQFIASKISKNVFLIRSSNEYGLAGLETGTRGRFCDRPTKFFDCRQSSGLFAAKFDQTSVRTVQELWCDRGLDHVSADDDQGDLVQLKFRYCGSKRVFPCFFVYR